MEIELPVPSDATTPAVRTSFGSAVYAPEREALLWKIKSFPGGKVCFPVELVELFHKLIVGMVMLRIVLPKLLTGVVCRNTC